MAEDFQYQFVGEHNIVSIAGTHIHENMNLVASYLNGGAANRSDSLNTSRIWANYYYQRRYGATFGWFSTTGTADSALYPASGTPPCMNSGGTSIACGVVTSANGSPDTDGFVGELQYLPWLNVRLSLQYTHYNKFNGASTNYDGLGRNASDNDSLYFLLWYAF